jgi:hypothetical protein
MILGYAVLIATWAGMAIYGATVAVRATRRRRQP